MENGLVALVGEGESGTSGESGLILSALSDIRWMAGEKLLCSTGNPVWCCVMTGSDGMGGGERG